MTKEEWLKKGYVTEPVDKTLDLKTEIDKLRKEKNALILKAEGLLAEYSRIGCFLDNDTAGRTACEHLKARFGERLFDKSIHYRGYKDLNDYLCGKSLSQSVEPMKQKQQVQSARRMMQPPKKRGLKM